MQKRRFRVLKLNPMSNIFQAGIPSAWALAWPGRIPAIFFVSVLTSRNLGFGIGFGVWGLGLRV